MKKKIIFILFILIIITGCSSTKDKVQDKLIIYALNDFHGDILDESGNISVIGNYLMTERAKDTASTLILASGDMFQGSAISNLSQGKVVLEAMKAIGFQSMTIGNHEFDWGIDVLNSLSEEAPFPFLGANILEKETLSPVSWAKPYTVIQKGKIKVGVIGIIGKGLTEDISPSIIAPYTFGDEFEAVKKYAKVLRTEEDCDIVIVSAHNDTKSINQRFADLSGEYQVDAVFNGHTHQNYYGEVMGEDGITMPYVQSGSYGSYIGKIEIKLDSQYKMKDGYASNIRVSSKMAKESTVINGIVKKYQEELQPIIGEVLGVSGTSINRSQGTAWAADALKSAMDVDVAIINTGGIRAGGFPIASNEDVTVGHIWSIMPFDNIVKTVTMRAGDLGSAISAGVMLSSNASFVGGLLAIEGEVIDQDMMISVATIDFLFDNTSYRFLDGINQVNTQILFRDVLINDIRETCADGSKWYAATKYR